jgi:integrase
VEKGELNEAQVLKLFDDVEERLKDKLEQAYLEELHEQTVTKGKDGTTIVQKNMNLGEPPKTKPDREIRTNDPPDPTEGERFTEQGEGVADLGEETANRQRTYEVSGRESYISNQIDEINAHMDSMSGIKNWIDRLFIEDGPGDFVQTLENKRTGFFLRKGVGLINWSNIKFRDWLDYFPNPGHDVIKKGLSFARRWTDGEAGRKSWVQQQKIMTMVQAKLDDKYKEINDELQRRLVQSMNSKTPLDESVLQDYLYNEIEKLSTTEGWLDVVLGKQGHGDDGYWDTLGNIPSATEGKMLNEVLGDIFAKRVHMGDPGKTAEKFKNRLGFIKIVAYFNEEGKYIRGPVRRFPAAQDVILELRVDPSVTGDKIGKAAAEDAIQSFTSLSVLTSGTLERASTRPGVNLLTGAGGWLTTTKKGDRSYKNGLFPLFDDTRLKDIQAAEEAGERVWILDTEAQDYVDVFDEDLAKKQFFDESHSNINQTPEVPPDVEEGRKAVQTGDVEQGPTNQQIEASAIGVNATGTEISVFDKPRRGKDAVTDAELEYRISITYDLHGEFADGKTVVLDKEIREGIRLDEQELRNRYVSRAVRQGWDGITEHEQTILQLQELMAGAGNVVADTEALVLGKGSGAADLAVFNENLVKSVTWDEYFNDPASQLVPVELLGFEDKVSKIVRRHLTGERELTADVMVRLDKAGKAAKDAYTWDTLRALALLYGVDATPYKIGLAGHKRLLAEHIEAVTALDVLMKAEGVDRLKQWVAGNLEGLEDMKPFREVYKKLFPGGEIVPPGGVGGSASVGAELENDITVLQTLVWVYRQKVENQIVDRSLINYLDYGYKAVLNPEVRDTLTSQVLMSYLFAETLAEARQGKGAVRGFSKFLTPKEQRSPIMRELFDKLDFHPQSFLSREQIKKGNWNIVRHGGDEFHFDTIEEAWQTVSEMAIQPRMEGEMDAGFRFGIKHSKAYGADTFTLYERSVDIATKTPYLLSWDDFLIWLRGNITDENRAKYGWKKWDVRDRTKFFSELSAIGGLVDSRSTAGMSADRLDAWKFAQDAREAVINKALKDGANVPVTYINQIEGMASHHLLRNNIAKANLFETIIPGPQGGALKYGEALKGVAKAGEGAKFVTLDDWEPIAEAFYKKDFAVEVEKLGSAFKNTPELRTVSPKQRELGRPVQYPDGVEAVLALNAAVINAESDLHLLRRVRTQINKYRGERTNRFLGYSDTLTERALRRIGGVEKEELLANAAHWETADDLFSRILTILDDKIYALDPQWHDNTLRLREAYKATLDDPTSALRRELDNIVDSQEGRKADPGRAGEQVRARTNKERPSYQDVERVLAALKDKAYAPGWTAKDLRTHVLAETLAGAASRIKRISNLAWKDVDVSAGEIWLRHKDFKSQTVSFKGGDRTGGTVYTLDPEAKKALKDWEQYCIDEWGPPNIGDETPVFTFIRDKEKWAGKKPVAITPGTLRNHLTGKNSLVAELFKGTDRTLKPHDFRRYFASKKFKHTFGDLKRTAELMNHKHPKYTVTYLLAMGHTIDELSGVISKSDYVIKSFASLKKVRAEIRKAVEAKQILDAQSVRVYRPHIRKANPRQVKEMRANWKKHLEIERSSDIKDLFKKGKEFAPRTSLNKRFFAEAARRSRGGTEDVRVIVKLLEALKDRREEALKQNPFGNMNFAEDIVQGFLHELESLSPKRILDRAPILPEVAGPRRFEGFRLVNEKGEWIDGGPLYRDKAAASKAADVLRGLSGVKTIGYNEVPDYLEFSWREMLGSAYDNWRREKWLHYHDEILAHPEYAYIVSEGIEARNILLGPRGHTIGLEEFDPFKKGPLSYDRYLTELETNLAIPLDTAQVLPRNMVPNDSIQESGKNSGRWLKQVRENKEIEPISLPTVTIDKKEVPILMVTPNRGYRLVPLEEYGEARKWAPGHVSGFEGVKVKWQVPVAQGGKGKKAPAKTFVMTRDTHFFRPDEFAERITGEKWRSDVLVSGLEGTFNTGSELSRYVVGLVDMDDLKTNRVARGGRMVENKEFPSIFKGEEPVDPTGEIPYGVLEIQARHLDVNSLLETTESYGLGMPTVTADGVVIDGSGRVNMLKMARDASKEHWLTHPPEEKAQALARGWLAYQEAVKENLSRFNFSGEARERLRDITSLKNPVMVRILKDELSDYHVARIVRQANDPRVVGSPDMLKRMVAQDIETLDYSMISEAKQGIDDLSSLFMTRTLPDGRVIKAGSQGPSRALRDRYSRAMLVKLFGRADNESEVYRLANFAVRNNDKHTRTLIKGILDNFKGLSDLREEELAFLFKNIQGTMVLIERARTQFPTVDFAVIVETLASGESKTFSVFLEDNPVVLEMARLLARDANSVAPGEAVVGMFKEFAGEVKKATPDQVEKMVQVTLLGDTPEEILRNAIRNNTPEGEFDRAAREGVEHIRNRSDTASGLGPTEDTAQADVMAGPGRGTGEALEGTEEIRRIEANRIRYQAVDLGIYIDYEPEDMANYIELRDSMLASGTDKARAKVKMRRYTKKTNAQGMEPADVIVAEQIEALDQRIMETVVNLSDTNWDLYRAVDIGGTNRGEWKSLEDLANWFPSPDAEDKFQTGMEIWEEALRRYYKRLLEKEWTPAEVIAYNQIMDKVGGKRADRALPEMRAIVTEKGQHSYTTMRTYWKLVDDVLLNKSGMPSGVYSTWEKGPPGHFVYTPEGIALRNKVVAHIHQGGDNPGHVARAAELVTAEEAQLEQVLDQMHILARLWYAPAEARASGGMRRTGGEAIGNFGEVMGTGMLAGKAERAPSDAHNLMLEMLRQKRNGVGIGKNLAMEQQGKIMENLAGGVHFQQIRKKPKGLKEDVWNNLNEFNIASEIDEFFTHGAVQIPSKLDQNPLLDKYSFTTAKEMVDELNRWIRRGHDQMKPFYSQLSPEWRIARETPMKYDMNSEIPTRLLERLAFVRKNAQVKEKGAQRALEYYSGKKKLDNYLNTLQGIGGGGGGTLRDIEDVTPYEEMLEWLESIFKEWRITLLGNEGILGNKIQLTPAERDQLFAIVKNDIIPDTVNMQRAASIGTADELVFENTVTVGPANMPWDREADERFDAVLWEWGKENQLQKHDTEWFKRVLLDGDPDIEGFQITAKAQAAAVAKELKSEYVPIYGTLDAAEANIKKEFLARLDKKLEGLNNKAATMNWYKEELVARQGHQEEKAWRRGGRIVEGQPREAAAEVAFLEQRPDTEQIYDIAPGYFEQARDASPVYMELGLHNPFEKRSLGRPIVGAVERVGTAMVDYSNQNTLDQMMKWVFPFWVFPTRSMKFWAEQLITKPEILAASAKIGEMSERMSYDAGLITTSGHQLPRFSGYMNLGGGQWWVNPRAVSSYTQMVPHYRDVYVEDIDPEAGAAAQVMHFLNGTARYTGLYLAPWLSGPVRVAPLGILDEEAHMKSALFGQTSLLPPWAYRDVAQKVNGWGLKLMPEDFGIWGSPNVPWKDFLIQRDMLFKVLEEMENLDDFEKYQLSEEIKVEIATREGPRWEAARHDLEYDETYARILGYLSGIHQKQVRQGEAELYGIRDEIGALRKQISIDANNEAFYKEARYNTAEGNLYGIYQTIANVREGGEPDGRVLWGDERAMAIAEEIEQNRNFGAYLAAQAGLNRMATLALAEQPVGAPREVRDPIYQERLEGEKILKENFPDVGKYVWSPYNKNPETIRKHVTDKWMHMLKDMGLRPEWNSEDGVLWDEYQKQILAWEAQLPEIADVYIEELLARLAEEELNVDVPDEETGETTNMFLDLYGGTREAAKTKLLAMATGDQWNYWDVQNDSLYDALNRVYRDNYYGAYWDFVGDSSKSERRAKERQWDEMYPGGPSEMQILEWMDQVPAYQGKWTDGEILLHMTGRDPLDIEERIELRNTPRENRADDIFKWYGWAGPSGSEFLNAVSTIGGEDMKDALLDMFKSERKQLGDRGHWVHWNEEFFNRVYNAAHMAAQELGLTEPTDAQNAEWMQVEALDVQFAEYREKLYGPDWEGLQDRYFAMSPESRVEWRAENPEAWSDLQGGWDMKTPFGDYYPVWQKYRDSDRYKRRMGIATATTAGTGSYAGAGGGVSGGDTWTSPVGPGTWAGWTPGMTVAKVFAGAGGTGSVPRPWPRIRIPPDMMKEILSGSVSGGTTEYLEALRVQIEPFLTYEDFLERLRELGAAHGGEVTAGGEPAVEWPWLPGYEAPTAVL